MISMFKWSETFLTRIAEVDSQHQRLVTLINDLAELVVSSDQIDPVAFQSIRDGILEYVKVHFGYEERLMDEVNLDPRHIHRHLSQHATFLQEATALGVTAEIIPMDQARSLVDYLVHWLAYHILDVDQSMARQMGAIGQGASPSEAFEAEDQAVKSSTEPLLSALSGMFYVVSERNRELRALNQQLEQRVQDRTKALEEANRLLQQMSTHDDLTGLPNRRFALATLGQLWQEMRRYGGTFAVLLLDADHFKAVNDQFGHAQGDALLRELASRLNRTVRSSDVVCRLGGDEFLVICPRASIGGAGEVARKILDDSRPFATAEGIECWNGSLSIGAAEIDGTMASFEEILTAADQAMYQSKREGGRRFFLAPKTAPA